MNSRYLLVLRSSLFHMRHVAYTNRAVAKKILKATLVAGFASRPSSLSQPLLFWSLPFYFYLQTHHRALIAWFSLLMRHHLRPSFIPTIVDVLLFHARIQLQCLVPTRLAHLP